MHKLLFASDLHGSRYGYEHLFRLALTKGIETIVLGGDLTPKLIALQLKDREPEGENPDTRLDILPGEVIPLDFLRPTEPNNTCTAALERISTLNAERTPAGLARELEYIGYLIHTTKKPTYVLEEMLDEHRVIDALCAHFRLTPVYREQTPLKFTTKRDAMTLEFLIERLHEIEEEYESVKREGFLKKYKHMLPPSEFGYLSFWDVALSVNLVEYITLQDKLPEIESQYHTLLRAITTPNPQIKDHWEGILKEGLKKARLAVKLGRELYLTEHTPLAQLGTTSYAFKLQQEATLDVFKDGQKKFIEDYLRDQLQRLKKANPAITVYAILGNDDLVECETSMRQLHDEGLLHYLNSSTTTLPNGLTLAGYSYVRSSQGSFYAGWEKKEEEIADDLERLTHQSDPKRTLYVIHTPAYGGLLDIAYNREHIGSTAVAHFIRQTQPLAVLSGHVHEAPFKSGTVIEMQGNTPCYNAGGKHDKYNLSAIVLDTLHPTQHERILEIKEP